MTRINMLSTQSDAQWDESLGKYQLKLYNDIPLYDHQSSPN